MTTIRTAQATDLVDLVRIGRASWRSAMGSITDAEYIQAGLLRWWTLPVLGRNVAAGNVLVADASDELMGLALVESDNDALQMRRLYVSPESQGLGIGTALVGAVIARAEAHPARCVHLSVLRANTTARRFYEARGFKCCPDVAHNTADPYPQCDMRLTCEDVMLPNPSRVVEQDRVTHLLYDMHELEG